MRGKHGSDDGAIGGGHELDSIHWHARMLQPLDHGGVDRVVGFRCFRPSTQYNGVARFETKRCGIGGYVRAAFVNDPDNPQRDPDA